MALRFLLNNTEIQGCSVAPDPNKVWQAINVLRRDPTFPIDLEFCTSF